MTAPQKTLELALGVAGQSFAPLPGWANGWRGRKKWLAQYQAQGGKCALCGELMPLEKMTKDHIIPRSKGGSPDWENIQLAYEPCNATKGDSLKAWARWALKAIERFSPNDQAEPHGPAERLK